MEDAGVTGGGKQCLEKEGLTVTDVGAKSDSDSEETRRMFNCIGLGRCNDRGGEGRARLSSAELACVPILPHRNALMCMQV